MRSSMFTSAEKHAQYLAQELPVVMHAVAMHVVSVSIIMGRHADSQHQTRYDISL
jgi:hypothetical protein